MNYNEIYNHSYFFKDSDNLSYRENRLRFGDQFSAICYTFGIHFLDVFQDFKDLTPRDFCWELAYPDNKGFRQFELIKQLVDYLESDKKGTKVDFLTNIGLLDKKEIKKERSG